MENVISVKNLKKSYYDFRLSVDELNIPKGCLTGIIGRNGAGKTTLIKSILGVTPINSGDIHVLGLELRGNEKYIKDNVGALIDGGTFLNFKVKDLGKNVGRFYSRWDKEAYAGYVERFGLDMNKTLNELSAGARTKAKVAVALSHHAELIILDEPSTGLDPIAREELMDLFAEIIGDEKAVVISTHTTSDLDRTADYIVMMHEGKVLFNRPKDELLESCRVVKGAAEALTDEVKSLLISFKTGPYGFEGLTERHESLSSFGDFLFERPRVEDIFRYYSKREEGRECSKL